MTKAELLAICNQNKIFHRSSWNKKQLEEAIASGIKFGDLVEQECPRSGLIFRVEVEESRVGLVHPNLSFYLNHKDYSVRYPAIKVIESKKWTNWADLKAAIELELNPPEPEWNFKGAWCARILGSSNQYRFERDFLLPIKKEGRHKYFDLDCQEGYYECSYKSAKGNETREYYQVQDGNLVEICLETLETLFPEIVTPEVSVEGCNQVNEFLGAVGSTVRYQEQIVTIVKTECETYWEDDEGIGGTGEYRGDCTIVYEETKCKTWFRPAAEEESAAFLQTEVTAKIRSAAVTELKEIANNFDNSIKPDREEYPTGTEFITQKGFFQANEILVLQADRLWLLRYNGRDGDLWDCNNVASAWIGFYREIDQVEHDRVLSLIKLTC